MQFSPSPGAGGSNEPRVCSPSYANCLHPFPLRSQQPKATTDLINLGFLVLDNASLAVISAHHLLPVSSASHQVMTSSTWWSWS